MANKYARTRTPRGLGLKNKLTYTSWQSMISRCYQQTSAGYLDYGARGIRVCERWLTFAHFLADMGPRPEGTTLDRIDFEGHYEPGNCRWADARTQNINRINCGLFTFRGELRTLPEIASFHNIPYGMLYYRVYVRDLSLGKAVSDCLKTIRLKRAAA